MPVLVLLDPALGATATLLRQALGPGFSVAVGSPPEGTARPAGYVVVTAAPDASTVAKVRRAFPEADLLAVSGGAAPERDPRRPPAIFAAGANTILPSLSVPELAAHVRAHAGRFPSDSQPAAASEPAAPGSGRNQVLARLSAAKRRLAVAAGFPALAGTVAWARERGSAARRHRRRGHPAGDAAGIGRVLRRRRWRLRLRRSRRQPQLRAVELVADIGKEHAAHVPDQPGEVGRVPAQFAGEDLLERVALVVVVPAVEDEAAVWLPLLNTLSNLRAMMAFVPATSTPETSPSSTE